MYVEDQWIRWHYFRQRQGQSVQEYTTEFRKMAIMMGISPKNPDVLNYLGVYTIIYKSR
jgi:lipoprotein NlpI